MEVMLFSCPSNYPPIQIIHQSTENTQISVEISQNPIGCSSHKSLSIIIASWPLSDKERKRLYFLKRYISLAKAWKL